jgi:hypothetical protein
VSAATDLTTFDRPTPSPVLSFLARRQSEQSRRGALKSLERAAELLSNGTLTALELPWEQVTADAMLALNARLIERGYSPGYCNLIRSCVRGVVKQY